jgi:hypothetical protein
MNKERPFFPINQPKFAVVFVTAGLIGMLIGLIGFTAGWFRIIWLMKTMIWLFMICWAIAAISFIGFVSGMITGRYRKMEPRSWKKQIW